MQLPKEVSTEANLRIQFVSDIHLEMALQPLPPIPVLAPVLALLGDIGYPADPKYEKFLTEQSARFELVLVVMGNHEFYKNSIEGVAAKCAELAPRLPKVRFLHKSSFMLHGVRVLGTTLWSHVPATAEATVSRYLNDYRYIRIGPAPAPDQAPRLITVADTNKLHNDERAWLEKELKEAKQRNERVLVLTHYAPTMKKVSHPRFDKNEGGSNHGFSSSLEHLLGKPVAAWLYGHTHFNNRQKIEKTIVASNQLGYNRGESERFDPTLMLEITAKKATLHEPPKEKKHNKEK